MSLQREALVLGSASPRRREILSQLRVEFTVVPSDLAEPEPAGEPPEQYAMRLAELKARAVAERQHAIGKSSFVLGADTVVVLGERVLGKPRDDQDALAMLCSLSGTRHTVITGVCLARAAGAFHEVFAVSTEVSFRPLDGDALRRYVASGEGRDKAGSYAIQGLGAGLVGAIDGSYSNVVGLPASETLEMLARAGVLERWP